MPTLILATALAASQSFLAIGDWGGTSDQSPTAPGEVDNNAGMAAAASAAGGVDYVLALGDNFYTTGIQGDSSSPRFGATFESVFTAPELQVPWYVVAGNHDHLGNVTAEIAYSAASERWTFPSYYYTFAHHFAANGRNITTQIVYIDTVLMAGESFHNENTGEFVKATGPADPVFAATQLQWLGETLAASTADYLWVAGHYPIYSQCEHGPTQQLIDDVLPLLEKYNATGYICGHDHCLGHFEYEGLALVLSGAGKECCYAPTHAKDVPPGATKFHMDAQNTYGAKGGFASFTVNETATAVKYHDTTGKVLYSADPVKPRR
ncbi:Purple acid phosphatase 7 [Diplonema papillatum]|nr:Purple acid phosphatase 7 [Diplonema papillatum]|eukprot:gene321-447_t